MRLSEENLYKKVKSDICRRIFEGVYQDGDLIPPERKLSEQLGVSRVTMRKALKLLEDEQIISRVQGSGTRVSMHYGAHEGDMEIITLVASTQNDFFSNFLDAFQMEAEKQDSLVLYKQKPQGTSLEKCLYQIYEKGIRNVVLWLEDMQMEESMYKVLRGLGLNLILFDTVDKEKYADAVCLDNVDAVSKLHQKLKKEGCRKIGYIGWDAMEIGSLRDREETYCKLEPEGMVRHISYQYHNHLNRISEDVIRETMNFMEDCDGIIYAVGELGSAFEGYAREKYATEKHAGEKGILHKAGMLGAASGAEGMGIYVVEQDFAEMSRQIFDCLKQQSYDSSSWKPGVYKIRGRKQFEE